MAATKKRTPAKEPDELATARKKLRDGIKEIQADVRRAKRTAAVNVALGELKALLDDVQDLADRLATFACAHGIADPFGNYASEYKWETHLMTLAEILSFYVANIDVPPADLGLGGDDYKPVPLPKLKLQD